MDIAELKQKVKDFEKKAGFDKTESSNLLNMLEEEIGILQANPGKKAVVDHKLVDLLILIMQLANRSGTNLDKELREWFKKSEKYEKRTRSKMKTSSHFTSTSFQ